MDCRDVAKIITVHTENRKFFLFLVVEASECAIPRPDDIDHVPNFDPQRTQHCLSHRSRITWGLSAAASRLLIMIFDSGLKRNENSRLIGSSGMAMSSGRAQWCATVGTEY